jgi:hypothetical protein
VTFATWYEPVRLLDERTGPATDQQRELASTIGFPLTGMEPMGVTAVMLEEHLEPLIWGRVPEPATDRQRVFLAELGSDEADNALLTKQVASAWIGHWLAVRTATCLRHLVLVRGDAVIKRTLWRNPQDGRLHEALDYVMVSSIGADGLVYFRGGNGQCGWPSSLMRPPMGSHQEDFPQLRELSDEDHHQVDRRPSEPSAWPCLRCLRCVYLR